MNFLQAMFSVDRQGQQASPFDNWRARYGYWLVLAILLTAPAALVYRLATGTGISFAAGATAGYGIIALGLLARSRAQLRNALLVVGLLTFAITSLLAAGVHGPGPLLLLGAATLTAILMSARAGMLIAALNFVALAAVWWLNSTGRHIPEAAIVTGSLGDWLAVGGSTLGLTVAAILGASRLHAASTDSRRSASASLDAAEKQAMDLAEALSERTRLFRRLSEIARSLGTADEPDEVMLRAAQNLSTEFNWIAFAVFLVDPTGAWAELKASAGESAEALKRAEPRVDLLGSSAVASAMQTKTSLVETSHSEDVATGGRLLLPSTQSRLTIPLGFNGRIIGALDVHSAQQGAFPPHLVALLEDVASQLATVIERTRLLHDMHQDLAELRAAQRQYLQSAWESFSGPRQLEYSLGGADADTQLTSTDFPLTLRDQIIGQISMASDQEWTPEQRGMVEAIATQAALALENARLMEESQSLAAQERLTADLTAKIWSATSAEDILRTTVSELGRALGTTETTIWPLAETGAEQHQSTVWQNAGGASMAHQYTPAGTQALAANSAVAPSDANTLRAPIILRGDRIGFTTLRRRPEDAAWTDREEDLIEKILAQTALALENSRLIQDVQRSARQSELLASVSGRVRETLDVDAIARTAAREFVRAFGLEKAQIQLHMPAVDAAAGAALDQQQLTSTSTSGASGEPQ